MYLINVFRADNGFEISFLSLFGIGLFMLQTEDMSAIHIKFSFWKFGISINLAIGEENLCKK
jgi:multisubunit Na+/H+ antiporter MnhC subunit